MKKILISILFFYSFLAYSQGEANFWYFSGTMGLDFNSGVPVPLFDGAHLTIEGSATISDASGNLLFYTNGATIWNKNHAIMLNGEGLTGNYSSVQSAIIVPKPGSVNIYYVFTVAAEIMAEGLKYSEVDMTLDGGLGAVTPNKNISLATPTTEGLTAVQHDNGVDFWVVSHGWGGSNSNAFYAYLVTASGVSATPVVTNVGQNLTGETFRSMMKISPDGRLLAQGSIYDSHMQLLKFDDATGALSSPIQLPGSYYGIEFSPSGNVLYAREDLQGGQIYQFDLTAPDIAASKLNFATCPLCRGAGMQLGPDGKIYFIGNFSSNLSIIHNPEVIGVGCNIEINGLEWAEWSSVFLGLPNFVTSFFSPVPVPDYNIEAINFCHSETTQFSIIGITPDSITWDFGDGATSSGLTAGHAYAASGTYTVTATVVTGSQSVTVTKEITIHPLPTAFVPDALVLCDDISNDGIETFDLSQRNAQILGGQPPTDFTISYHLTESDAKAGINPIGNSYTNTANPGLVHARVTNNVTGCHAETQLTLFVWPYLEVEMDDTFSFCEGGSITLIAPDGYIAYAWSTGESTQSITVNVAGQYTVTVSSDNGEVICQASKTVTVTGIPSPVFEMDEEYTFCKKGGVWVKVAEGFDSYQWSTGETTNTVFISQTGNYSVAVTKEGCETIKTFKAKEILCGFVIMPKGISPNADGLNDKLDLSDDDVTGLYIYNRYGLQVYHKDNYTDEWHGQSDDGDELPTGTYFYSVQSEGRPAQSGWIYVNREIK